MCAKKVPASPPMPTMLSAHELSPSWGLAAVVDCETTGFDYEKDELIEIAVVLFAFDRETHEVKGVVDEYVGQREPGRSIPRDATAVHGLTKRMLKGKDLDYVRLREIARRAEFYVAHNADFDERFCGCYFPPRPWYCSMRHVVWTTRTEKWQKLEKLLRRYGITEKQTHRAIDDAKGLLTLLSLRNKAGETFLHEMITRAERQKEALERLRREAAATRVHEETERKRPRAGCLTLTCLILTLVYLLSRC